MNLMNKTEAKKSFDFRGLKQILTVIILAAALFFIWTLFLGPQYSEFQLASDNRSRILAELADVDKQIQDIESLSAQLDTLSSEDLNKLNLSLPIGEGLEDFLASMHKLALQSQLTILSMYVTPVEGGAAEQSSDLKKSQLSLSLRGNYVGTLSFLQLLQRHVRVVNIQSFNLADVTAAASGVVPAEETLQVNITAEVFNLGDIPETPLFPYGKSLSTAVFDSEQFRALQIIATILPTDVPPQTNPFSPR